MTPFAPARSRGFTVIELMIAVAVIAIVAAIAIPNLLQGRLQTNEANALAAMKAYATAQVTFQRANFSAVPGNAAAAAARIYTANFSNLHYGADGGGALVALLTRPFADAREDDPALCPTFAGIQAPGPYAPYQGYLFNEDPYAAADTFRSLFCLVGLPAAYARTGYHAYWIGTDGIARLANTGSAPGAAATAVKSALADTPLSNPNSPMWQVAK